MDDIVFLTKPYRWVLQRSTRIVRVICRHRLNPSTFVIEYEIGLNAHSAVPVTMRSYAFRDELFELDIIDELILVLEHRGMFTESHDPLEGTL